LRIGVKLLNQVRDVIQKGNCSLIRERASGLLPPHLNPLPRKGEEEEVESGYLFVVVKAYFVYSYR
jgi:hypothetical protein